jgi:hypothetical protein
MNLYQGNSKMRSSLLSTASAIGLTGVLLASQATAQVYAPQPGQSGTQGGAVPAVGLQQTAISGASPLEAVPFVAATSGVTCTNKIAQDLNDYVNSSAKVDTGEEVYEMGSAQVNLKPDVKMDDVIKMRNSLFRKAYLTGHGKVISRIMTVVSAEALLTMPGNPLPDTFAKRRNDMEDRIKNLQTEIVRLSKDAVGADAVAFEAELAADATNTRRFEDRLLSMADALTKKIDPSFSPESAQKAANAQAMDKAAAERKRSEKLRAELELLKTQHAEFVKEAEEEKSKISEQLKNSVTLRSKMPLLGTAAIKFCESHIGNVYDIAVVMKWSKVNESAAHSILLGEKPVLEPKPGRNKATFMATIPDKSTMLGAMPYTDDKGDRVYVAFGAYPTYGGGTNLTKAQEMADAEAMQNHAFALFATVESTKQANSQASTQEKRGGPTDIEVDDSYTSKVFAAVKDLPLGNTISAYSGELIHTPTGQPVWVKAISLNSTASATALSTLKNSYAKAANVALYQGTVRGVAEGAAKSLDDAQALAKTREAQAAAETRREMAPSAAMPASNAAPPPPTANRGNLLDGSTGVQPRNQTPKKGSYGGGGFTDD